MTRILPVVVAAIVGVAVATASPRAEAGCTFKGLTPITFNAYSVYDTGNDDGSGFFTYNCSVGTIVTVTISAGGGGTILTRALARIGGGSLSYQIYSDATRLLPFGDTLILGLVQISSGADKRVDMYGRIFPLQDVPSGSYSDTVVIGLNF